MRTLWREISQAKYWAAALALSAAAHAQVTTRESVGLGGLEADGQSWHPSISGDGRFVAFASFAGNLVSGDANGAQDIFVRDRLLATNERVSVATSGAEANANSHYPAITPDGRFVAFVSEATNLVPGDTNGEIDAFVRDRLLGTTERVSVGTAGEQGNDQTFRPSISSDGRYVAFSSAAGSLVAGDTNGVSDVFVRDRQTGTTSRVSLSSSGSQGNGASSSEAISADGRYVAFQSAAYDLVPGDGNACWDVFLRDRQTGQTTRVSVDTGGLQGDRDSLGSAISSDGQCIVFLSYASNLVAGDTNATADVFVHEMQDGLTTRVSVSSDGAQGDSACASPLSVSADGRIVSFPSWATNLVPGDTNHKIDSFVHDRATAQTLRASVATNGGQAVGSDCGGPAISSGGRYVAFGTWAANLVAGDTNGTSDVFVRDLHASGFTSLCDAGAAGVLSCPCANPPSGPGRGCDNSSGTGGAILAADGAAYLSADSLVLATQGERPAATSIVVQGRALASNGVAYGQGVRCAAGRLLRLYTTAAVGGSITAPDFGAGDPSVSVRSAALGDAILAGETRWYFVYYRDPIVLGGCPPNGTFNTTQTGASVWSP